MSTSEVCPRRLHSYIFDIYYLDDVLTISSKGNAASFQWSRMGIFEKMVDIRANEMPVWRMKGGDQYLFFSGGRKYIYQQFIS